MTILLQNRVVLQRTLPRNIEVVVTFLAVVYYPCMKTWKLMPFTFCFLLLYAVGCTSELPYLTLTVASEYTSSTISIPYSFKSEQSEQPCKVTLDRADVSEDSTVYSREEWMEEEGTLYYENLEAGEYQLRFVVLSARGSGEKELAFLDETYNFTVTY